MSCERRHSDLRGAYMNLHQLKYVLAVARERSFSKAAASLYMTQPSLSRFIISWEDQLGVKVFDRSTSPLGLTPAGKIVIQAVERICEIEQKMMESLEALKNSEETEINFGATPARARHLIKRIAQFKSMHPNVKIQIYELFMNQLMPKLVKGELDFVFGAGPSTDPNLDFMQISSEQFYLIAPQKHEKDPLTDPYLVTEEQIKHGTASSVPFVDFSAFKDEPVIGYHQNMRLQQTVLKLYADSNLTPNIVAHSHSADMGITMVREGIGITIASSTSLKSSPYLNQIRCFRLNLPEWPLGVFVHKNKPLSPQSRDFIAFLDELV